MKIKLTCKLYDGDAQYFIDPIKKNNLIKSLTLYRDNIIPDYNDIVQVDSFFKKINFLNFPIRFFKMIFLNGKADVFIGIYEIPHGMLSVLCSLILNKKSVVCIIGNPKYSIRNKGIRGLVTKFIYFKADIITVTGLNSKNFLVNNKGVNSKKIYILPNSVPSEEYSKKIINKKYDLITLGRLSEEKGLFNLLEIVKHLKNKYYDVKLGVAGKGELYDKLKLKIQDLNLNKNIDLLGYVEDSNLFLNSGKIFVSTSFTEGLPRTIIQSMFCGVPVVSSDVGDISDLIINGKNGFLIKDPNNIMEYVKQIDFILSNSVKQQELSKNCNEHVSKLYSHDKATRVWSEILNKLII